MAIAEQIYELVKSLPEQQAIEVLTFIEFIREKRSGENKSTTTDTSENWPDLVHTLAGAWQDDFPNLEDIRTNLGQDILRESF